MKPGKWRLQSKRDEGVISRLGLILNPTEKLIFLSLYYWRDVVARENDESVQFILPLIHILNVVEKKPTTVEALAALLSRPSYVVSERLDRLFAIVEKCLNVRQSPEDRFL